MSPKEKAIELVTNMSFSKSKVADYATGEMIDIPGNIFYKQCALFAVNEILNINSVDKDEDLSNYWEEVKQEIENL